MSTVRFPLDSWFPKTEEKLKRILRDAPPKPAPPPPTDNESPRTDVELQTLPAHEHCNGNLTPATHMDSAAP
ncbi:hypothetical protein ACJQWK_05896 [Exserohilum turcicum]|uniref:Uncharacterized protein n=1 Tax=Exserohilum turcicum (strain 28A) TaxID=671987 RepID=R0KAJ8_EXST2|nr:uncharacterized protein SETTUDRAFT_47476 [Exserohilum turcica Et28A]EOA86454.1 hypothetical protein SETTUDRAFT_47476 [Exserohilum turcica Et28A]